MDSSSNLEDSQEFEEIKAEDALSLTTEEAASDAGVLQAAELEEQEGETVQQPAVAAAQPEFVEEGQEVAEEETINQAPNDSDETPVILFIAIGSRGDVQPSLACAIALKNEGYRVHLAAHPEFRKFVEAKGIEFSEIGGSLPDALAHTEDGRELVKYGVLTAFSKAKSTLTKLMGIWLDDIVSTCRRIDPDLLILSTHASYLSTLIHDNLPIAYVILNTVPQKPTTVFAPPGSGAGVSLKFGFLNRLAWFTGDRLLTRLYCGILADIRQSRNMAPIIDGEPDPILKNRAPNIPTLYAYSRHILPKPSDWTEVDHVMHLPDVVTGPLCLPPDTESLPDDILSFISNAKSRGGGIVYIGLGSMLPMVFSEDERMRKVLHACCVAVGLSKSHAIVNLSGWEPSSKDAAHSIIPPQFVDRIYISTNGLPHTVLFPQMDAIVHHGGAGTTHTVVMSGKPSVVIPCAPNSDQTFWADALVRLKVAPEMIPLVSLSGKRLANALSTVLSSAEMRRAASELAIRVRKEDGLGEAVSVIRYYLDKRRHQVGEDGRPKPMAESETTCKT